jgi:hypothetical protein
MLKNCLSVALRSLTKHTVPSLINIAGLTVGTSCCLLILLYVRDGLDHDRVYGNREQISRVAHDNPFDRLIPMSTFHANTGDSPVRAEALAAFTCTRCFPNRPSPQT